MRQRNGAPQIITPAKRHTKPQQQHPDYTRYGHSLQGQWENIPDALKETRNWLGFRVTRADDGALEKTPVGGASSTDTSTHQGYAVATQLVMSGRADVLGYALPEDRRYTGLDFDHCLDTDGNLLPWAASHVAPFIGRTYCEVTPSGAGLRFYVLGTKSGPRCKRKFADADGAAIEVYDHERLFTVTGNRYQDAPVTIAEMQGELDALYAALFPARKTSKADYAAPSDALDMDDEALLMRARNAARSGARFRQLFDAGDTSGNHDDHSAADLALCNLLAFWCGPDEARIDNLFRRSGLMRDKWERADYRVDTIGEALDGRTMFYMPKIATAPTPGNQFDCTPPAPGEEPSEPCAGEGETITDLSAALAEIARLKAENAALRTENASQRQAIASMNEFRIWIDETLAIPERRMSASEKLVAIAMRRWDEGRRWDKGKRTKQLEDGAWNVRQAELADATGFSTSTISKAWARWGKADAGPIQLKQKEEPVPVTDSKGVEHIEMHTMTYANLHPAIHQPKTWMPPNGERDRGGKRENAGRKKLCEDCGAEDGQSEQVMIETAQRKVLETRCKQCGTVHYERLGPDKVISRRPDGNQFENAPSETSADGSAAPSGCPTSVDASIGGQIENTRAEINLIAPPQRPCIRCGVYDWRLDGERWYCGSCSPEERQVS